jgi:hypothetical protein
MKMCSKKRNSWRGFIAAVGSAAAWLVRARAAEPERSAYAASKPLCAETTFFGAFLLPRRFLAFL